MTTLFASIISFSKNCS